MRQVLYLIFALTAIAGCKNSGNGKKPQKNKVDQIKSVIPDFRKDSAYYFVYKQVNFGPRIPNTAAHQNCKNWIVEKFKQWQIKVSEQNFSVSAFDGTVLNGTNIIAELFPEKEKRILLAAHWDTRPTADHDEDPKKKDAPIDGADDGASGVAVLMELARSLRNENINLGIDIVLFDCEDYGEDGGNDINSWALGSQHWSRNLHRHKAHFLYGVLLDMVGASNPRFSADYISLQHAPSVVQKVWKTAHRLGYKNNFVIDEKRLIVDDHYFVNKIAGIPMIDIIHLRKDTKTGFVSHWHTTNDNMDNIDAFSLLMVGRVLLNVIYTDQAKN